jgi:hypothetical protein
MASRENLIGRVVAVCSSETKAYPKYPQEKVRIGPHGIDGDAHAGALRQSHRNPDVLKPNNRAVSIVAKEVMDDVNSTLDLNMKPGDFNENILVEGLGDLADLRKGDQLIFGNGLVIDVTDQNPPCKKLDAYNGRGLIKATIGRTDGEICNKRGVLGVPQQTTDLAPNVDVRIQKAETFTETPVLPKWHEAYKYANLHHPQTYQGIKAFVGREIVASLQKKEVNLEYITQSGFTPRQLDDLAETTARAHGAHGISVMPEGRGRSDFEFPVSFYNEQWVHERSNFFLLLIEFNTPPESPMQNELINALKRPVVNSETLGMLNRFSNESSWERTLPMLADFFEGAVDVLDSSEGKRMASLRRDMFNRRNKRSDQGVEPSNMVKAIENLVKEEIRERAKRYKTGEGNINNIIDMFW